VKTDSPVMPFTPDEARISDKTILYVTEDTYGYLKENVGGAVHLECRYSVAERRDNNIIGMIKGNNAKKALVLSAHFDHVGSVGDQIFRGAVDNASGTAALLDIAKLLSGKVKKDSLDMDIIFAFFNAEEIGKSGSKAFAEKIQSKYGYKNVTDINIDCVGSVEEKPLHICCSNENLREAARVLIKRLNGNFIPDVEESLGNSADSSDHVWFENSIYIYTDSDIIHTLKDTIVNVNIKAIENISECVAGLVLNFPRNTEKGKSHEADKSTGS
jgi:aminopeptidase YwaD